MTPPAHAGVCPCVAPGGGGSPCSFWSPSSPSLLTLLSSPRFFSFLLLLLVPSFFLLTLYPRLFFSLPQLGLLSPFPLLSSLSLNLVFLPFFLLLLSLSFPLLLYLMWSRLASSSLQRSRRIFCPSALTAAAVITASFLSVCSSAIFPSRSLSSLVRPQARGRCTKP